MKRLVSYLVFLFAGFAAWAQEAPSAPAATPLPKGPLLAFAPEYSSWVTVRGDASLLVKKVNAPSSGNAELKRVKRVQTVKTGAIRYILTIGGDGLRSEIWCQGSLQVFKGAEWGGKPLVIDARSVRSPLDFSKTDFPECAWISETYYQGMRRVLDRDCMVFIKTAGNDPRPAPGTMPDEVSQDGPRGKLQAYVDLQTRLPILLVEGESVTTYEFGLAPTAMLTFPIDVQAAIDEKRILVEKLTARPPRPF